MNHWVFCWQIYQSRRLIISVQISVILPYVQVLFQRFLKRIKRTRFNYFYKKQKTIFKDRKRFAKWKKLNLGDGRIIINKQKTKKKEKINKIKKKKKKKKKNKKKCKKCVRIGPKNHQIPKKFWTIYRENRITSAQKPKKNESFIKKYKKKKKLKKSTKKFEKRPKNSPKKAQKATHVPSLHPNKTKKNNQ